MFFRDAMLNSNVGLFRITDGGYMKNTMFVMLFVVLISVCAQGQENRSPTPLEDINVEFMMRGYFLAGSLFKKDEEGFGGFGGSSNYPKALDKVAPDGVVSLIAMPDQDVIFAKKYKGLKVLLINGMDGRVKFTASDSRLSIVQEALDADGQWKPVEYLPGSFCGNSYHIVSLGPKEYWEFAAARYKGKFKTRLRFRLDWNKSENENLRIYSNEFDGSVNAEQFTVMQGHKRSSIMDPYIN